MKPDWDKLMKNFEGSDDLLVADVDCTAAGKSKCKEMKITGYPSIMYGPPGGELQKYKGPRGFDDLKKFAESLGATGAADDDEDDLGLDPDFDPDLADPSEPINTPRATTTTTTTTQCYLESLESCSQDFKEKVAEYRSWSLIQIDGLIKAKEARRQKTVAAGKKFLEDQILRLLHDVREEKAQQNLERGEL